MGIIHGSIIGNLYTIPYREFQFQLVSLIPHSVITKTILVRFLIFHYFTRVANQSLKQGLKQKRRIILSFNKLQNIFLFVNFRKIFCFEKMYNFLLIIINTHSFLQKEQENVTGHSFYKVFYLENILTVRWASTN